MAISRSPDTEERRYEMMHRGMRHEEVQKLHVHDLLVFRLMQQGIPVKEIPKRHADVPLVFRLM